MATYVNDLRLKEIATGDEAGTWGTSTNTNLELIGEALGYGTQDCFASDADATTTVADGATDPARAMYFKVTSSATLTATRTLTIAPNTISRVMLIENATTGSQSITISQGSGSTVTIASGAVKMVYLDGAGAGGAVVEALADLELPTVTVADLTATTADINGGTIDGVTIGGASAGAGTFTTLTANGNVVLGDAATDTVTVTADIASDLIPSVDGSFDLGASGAEWQDLFIDGTANIDSLVADTADINAGTIDGTVIGGSTAAAGTFTTGAFSGDTTIGAATAATNVQLTLNGVASKAKRIKFAESGVDKWIIGQGAASETDAFEIYNTNGQMSLSIAKATSAAAFSGKVGIGNSSPLGRLTISNAAGANAPTTVTAANTYLQLGSDDYGPSNNGKFMIGFGYTDATNTNSPAYIGFEETSSSGDTKGELTFYTRDVTTDTAPTERMRIDSSGKIQIGNNIPMWSGQYGGALILKGDNATSNRYAQLAIVDSSGAIVSNGLILDNSGNLLVGTTGTFNSSSHCFSSNAVSYAVGLRQQNASGSGLHIEVNANNGIQQLLYGIGAGTNTFIVYSNGNVENANNSYGAISDSKLKENIVDASPKLADLMQVKVRNYNLIGDTAKQLGVVAQELETVFPAMVEEAPDRDKDGNDLGTTTKSVKYSVFVPMLIKAMQEQQEQIQDLKAEVAALKGAN